MIIVWKVVEMPNRRSWIAMGMALVRYPKGRKTFPRIKGTPLFAYKTKEEADKTRRKMGRTIKCEAGPFHSTRRVILDVSYVSHAINTDIVKEFWSSDKSGFSTSRIPKGTVLCEWIRPLE